MTATEPREIATPSELVEILGDFAEVVSAVYEDQENDSQRARIGTVVAAAGAALQAVNDDTRVLCATVAYGALTDQPHLVSAVRAAVEEALDRERAQLEADLETDEEEGDE